MRRIRLGIIMSSSQTMCDRCRERKKLATIVKGAYGYTNLCKACRVYLEPEKDHRGKL
jgi:hypothetical protein